MKLSRLLLFLLLCLTLVGEMATAQVPVVEADSATAVLNTYRRRVVRDSAFLARQKFVTDSIMRHTWLFPDSAIDRNIIMDSILKANTVGVSNLMMRYKDFGPRKLNKYQAGTLLPKGKVWVLAVIAVLLIVFAVLKISFAKPLQTIVQSFFSNRVLNNLNKEDNLFTSWPFLLLFIQFGFTVGMFLFLVSQFYNISYSGTGFQFYISISVLIVVLYIFKIIILRLLGYLFNIQKPINEYVIILYLSYFNLSLLFIPLVVAFALSPLKYGPYYVAISFVLLVLIFVFQFIRAGINILSHHQFSKVYLFLYFCALEICPILILIKAVGL